MKIRDLKEMIEELDDNMQVVLEEKNGDINLLDDMSIDGTLSSVGSPSFELKESERVLLLKPEK